MNYVTQAGRTKRFVAAATIVGFAALLASPVMAKSKSSSVNTSKADAYVDSDADLRLALDKAQLEADSGKLNEAYSLVNKLDAKYPNNPDVKAVKADIEDRMSSRSSTLSELCLPSSLNPNNTDILMHEREYGASAKNSVCAGYNRRVTPEGYQQITGLDGQMKILSPSMAIIYDLENVHLNTTSPFNRANGVEQSFYGNRQQGTVMLQKTFANRSSAGISVFGNDNNAGGGLQYVMRDRTGGTSLQVNYQKPNWDYVEMIVQDGTKSDIRIERKQVLTTYLQATLAGFYNHYSLSNFWGAADAPGWDFNLDYVRPIRFSNQGANDPSWMNDEFTFGAHYGVEAEYFTYVGRRTDRTGDTFNAIPATTYEVHSFTGSVGKALLPQVDGEIEGGYSVNRISGGSGPIYGGSLTYSPIQHLGVDVHAMRTLQGGQNNGQKEDLAGASLKWTW